MRRSTWIAPLALAATVACSDSSSVGPTVEGCNSSDASRSVVALQPFQARTFRGAELEHCLWVTGGGARYLVVPQFASDAEPRELTRYLLGSGGSMSVAARVSISSDIPADVRFDNMLRRIERQFTPAQMDGGVRLAQTRASSGQSGQVRLQQQPEQTKSFIVLSKIPQSDSEKLQFDTVTAQLRFTGTHILIYVDTQAPTGANGLSDSVLTRLGTWFDRDLFPLTVSTFGETSDIDGNGRVNVLMTPVVNGLTSRSNCNVLTAGFFFGLDLLTQPNSNRGEVFYSFVADPQGTFGCARSVRALEDNLPQVFVHELQHMINFNQHRLVRRGPDEETWLDEGLSHMAEEVAARFYENKYGPPSPPRIFNDTANIFILDNLVNSYEYLESTPTTSLTLFDNTGTIEERGAAWLFLRWLVDQRDSTILRQLVQTPRVGIDNVAAVAGESFPSLFGDYAISLWTDSIPGHPRTNVPRRNRFVSRNLRVLYARLHTILPSQFPREYPLVLRPLMFEQSLHSSMYPGAMEHWDAPSSGTDAVVGFRFARTSGEFFAPKLGAQVGLFRLP